jgi:hypothetical protein
VPEKNTRQRMWHSAKSKIPVVIVVGLRLVVQKAKGGPRRFFCFRWRSEKDEGWSEG